MTSFIVLSILTHSISTFAADSTKDLLACANQIASARGTVARVGPDALVVTAHEQGWSLVAIERGKSYRCLVPPPIEVCFRANPNCRAFDFLLAHPSPGVRVGFDGASIDDRERLDRVTRVEKLGRGTVDERGLVRKVIPGGTNPTMGLKCVADASPATIAAFERALGRVIADWDHSKALPTECKAVPTAKGLSPRPSVVPPPEIAPAAR